MLRVKVTKESTPATVVHTYRLDGSNIKLTKDNNPGIFVQIPSIRQDDKTYSIYLESISSHNGKSVSEPYYFIANSSFKYVELDYTFKISTTEQLIKQTSVWTLVFVFILMIGIYNIEQVLYLLKGPLEKINFSVSNIGSKANVYNQSTISNAEIDELVHNIVTTKRKPKPKKI